MTPQEHIVIGELDAQRDLHRRNVRRLKLAEAAAEERRLAFIRTEQIRLRTEFYARRAAA